MKKRFIILIVLITSIIILVFTYSAFIKKGFTKKIKELIGRQITIDDLDFNPATFSFTIKGLTIYETNEVDTFIFMNEAFIDLSSLQLKNDIYAISEISMDGLYINIVKNKQQFNFDDLYQKKETASVTDTTTSSPIQYSFKNISIRNSNINFSDQESKQTINFSNLNLKLPELAWDNKRPEIGLDFNFGHYGKMHIKSQIDQNNQTYTVNLKINDFNLHSIKDYFTEYINIKDLTGSLNINCQLWGSLENIENLKIGGTAEIKELVFYGDNHEELASIKSISTDLLYFKPTKSSFFLKSIKISEPHLNYSFNNESNNWDGVFISNNSNRKEDAESNKLNYLIKSASIEKGSVSITDHTLKQAFNYHIKDININTIDIENQTTIIPINYSANLNEEGSLKGNIKINKNQPDNYSINAKLSKLQLATFSPYSEYYLAYPILNGFLTYDFSLSKTPESIVNHNAFEIFDPIFGKKTHDNAIVKVPVRAAFNVLKGKNDLIKFDIPIEGNPSDPEFSLSEKIKTELKKFLTEAASKKVKEISNTVKTKVKQLNKIVEIIKLKNAQDKIPFNQKPLLMKVADRVVTQDANKIIFSQYTNSETEKEEIALQEVKIQYLMSKQKPAKRNRNTAQAKAKLLSDNKPDFVQYINQNTTLSQSATIKQKCINIIGESEIDNLLNSLISQRNTNLEEYLSKLKMAPNTYEIKTNQIIDSDTLSTPIFIIEEVFTGNHPDVYFEE